MSHRRAHEIRKRIAKKRKQRPLGTKQADSKKHEHLPVWTAFSEEDGKHGNVPVYEGHSHLNGKHPLIKADALIIKSLLSACLVLVSAIAYKGHFEPIKQIKPVVSQIFTEEFQFASLSNWYESTFGHPLAMFKPKNSKQPNQVEVNQGLVTPAMGKVQEKFSGQGIKVETESEAIESMKEGYVIEMNKSPKTGLTIVIQHADNSYSYYGQLKKANVALYDFVDKGSKLGTIQQNKDHKGVYYFAIKQGEEFVDPIQVISFDD
ncbi:peptidoglycan DD-metalloendopeptidase family protein [Bacillus changyiensis]|uniref:peptidoglycan DD-metalloendopeptidase family protein n=1 Tax=Bacillus changyiensis TaxID=3004103 RepID=UPI0022DFBE0F|nr:peptidoglycan DD-metalloendopeptidase family protein [Bacillus changyiensis]MDA1477440.1 peptidoglycan DD-metalloendopeptidase family protein [Bacillus changyiensis]